jgi:competence protein ComEA
LDEATPRWRTFSSDVPDRPAEDEPPRPAPGPLGGLIDGIPVVSAALGGAAAGAAVVVLAVALLGPDRSAGAPDVIGPARASELGGLGDSASGGSGGTVAPGGAGGEGDRVIVDVSGAVMRPGLHRLASGARVGDAIAAAGGYAPRVDLIEAGRSLNLAQPLDDGAKVLVPELGLDGARQAGSNDTRIDLNTADQAALETLPGIGPVTAGKIIEARSQGRFRSVGDLLARGIVGQAVFEDIEALVRASG